MANDEGLGTQCCYLYRLGFRRATDSCSRPTKKRIAFDQTKENLDVDQKKEHIHRNYSWAGKIRESSPLLWGKPFRDLHHDRKDSSVPGPGRSES